MEQGGKLFPVTEPDVVVGIAIIRVQGQTTQYKCIKSLPE